LAEELQDLVAQHQHQHLVRTDASRGVPRLRPPA
jgi:hypothetical protein